VVLVAWSRPQAPWATVETPVILWQGWETLGEAREHAHEDAE